MGSSPNGEKFDGRGEEEGSSSSSPSRVPLKQFADILGVTYQTALRYRDEGKVAVLKIGGRFFVTRSELDRFLKEGNRGE